jgi:hypothetical protein
VVIRRTLLLTLLYFGPIAGSRLFADVVTLNDGRQISGSVESGNTQELHIKVGDQSQTIDIHEVQIIQLAVSSSAPAPSKASATASEPAPDQPNTLFLNDGTHVAGRWWSIDATDITFLVNSQLQHYPRTNVSGVTSGNATLPPPPARSTAPPPAPAPASPAAPAQPARTATLKRPSAAPSQASTPPVPTSQPAPTQQPSNQQTPTLKRPTPTVAAAPSRGVSQPDEVGMVYFWNGRLLIPLERTPAVERKKGSAEYFEIQAPKSAIRVSENSTLVFVLRLPRGVDPASYSLFQLVTVDGNRQTRPRPDRQGAFMTWPVDIEINSESGLVTYNLSVRDLPPGEWSFSPSSSNDGYCFGVDPEK